MPQTMRKRRKKKIGRTIVVSLLVILVLCYIGYQAYRSVYTGVNTELATLHSVYDSIETEALIYREETLVSNADDGYPYFLIENGAHVAKNGVIASVYQDPDSGHIGRQIDEIDEQIQALKTIVADAGSGRLTLDVINEQFSDTLLQLIRDTELGCLDTSDDQAFHLLSLLSKKALITGKDVDFTAKIQELEDKKAALKASYSPYVDKITAPDAGYFANTTDGYEELLSTAHITDRTMTVASLTEHFDLKPKSVEACGKIVRGYEWFLACIVPDTYYNALGEKNRLTIRLPFVMDEAIPVVVEYAKKDNKGQMVVVFRCDQMNAQLATIRQETVEIQLVEHTGIKVPKRALVEQNGVMGVYVRSGNVVAFRKIKQQYSQPADYVICEIIEEDGYLRMYDDIIVGGRDLYDGKIIR